MNNLTSTKPLPDFQPSISDKFSYEEEMEYRNNLTSTKPLTESDIVQIILTESWFLKNDEDPCLEVAKITVPKDRLNKAPVNKSEPIVVLRISKSMLKHDNTNDEPGQITLSYPVDMFKFYSNIDEMKNAEINSENGICEIDRQVRAWYNRKNNYDVVRITGIINPTSYINDGETFRNYNEIEIYLERDGDTIEFISDFLDNGNAYVWAAIYDESSWVTPMNWMQVNVTENLQPVEYYLYMDDGIYDLWLKDTLTENWYHETYNDRDNPSTRVDFLTGSTEIDTRGDISEYFRTETNPIQSDWTYANGDWYRPKTTFDWHSYSADEQYVYIKAWWDSSDRMNTQHVTGIYY